MSRLNATWHGKHQMPRDATLNQRLKWHLAHAKACGCREIPRDVLAELMRRGISSVKQTPPGAHGLGLRPDRELLVATLMHGSLTASTLFIFTPVAAGASFLIYTSALAGAMWIVVAAVVLANSGQPSRRPLQRRMA